MFEVHKLNTQGMHKARQLQTAFEEFLTKLERICGTSEGREMAIVRTKLEEASFFAKRCMALDTANQDQE